TVVAMCFSPRSTARTFFGSSIMNDVSFWTVILRDQLFTSLTNLHSRISSRSSDSWFLGSSTATQMLLLKTGTLAHHFATLLVSCLWILNRSLRMTRGCSLTSPLIRFSNL